MATPQEMLNNLRRSTKEVDAKSEKILKKLEENKNAIDEFYNRKINDLNNLNPQITDENGNVITFDASQVTGDKHEYLKMYYAEYDADNPVKNGNYKQRGPKPKSQTQRFQEALKNEVQKVDKSKKSLKEMAESILKYKTTLVEKNKETIEELKESLASSADKRANLQNEINSLNEQLENLKLEFDSLIDEYDGITEKVTELENERNDLESEQNNLRDDIKDKKDELEQAKNDNKSQDEINALQTELNALNTKYSSNSLRIEEINNTLLPDLQSKLSENERITEEKNILSNNLENDKNAKESELNNLPDEATYNAIISEMEQINNDLDKSLEKNIEDFVEKFDEVEIEFKVPSEDEIIEEERVTPEEEKQENKDKKNNENPAPATENVAQNHVEENSNSMIPIDGTSEAKFRVDTFLNTSFDEQKRMLDYYGYAQLADIVSNVGPFQRRKLTNTLEKHLENSIPRQVDFVKVVDSIAGSLGINSMELFNSLVDEENNAVAYSNVNIDRLKEINKIVSYFYQNRDNFSEEQIKEFDTNFMQLVKNGALLQKAKTGRIANFFSGLTKRSTELKSILNSMSAYTWKNANSLAERNCDSLSMGSRLGNLVNRDQIETTRIDSTSRARNQEIHR